MRLVLATSSSLRNQSESILRKAVDVSSVEVDLAFKAGRISQPSRVGIRFARISNGERGKERWETRTPVFFAVSLWKPSETPKFHAVDGGIHAENPRIGAWVLGFVV